VGYNNNFLTRVFCHKFFKGFFDAH
jgi:hypothetical protein